MSCLQILLLATICYAGYRCLFRKPFPTITKFPATVPGETAETIIRRLKSKHNMESTEEPKKTLTSKELDKINQCLNNLFTELENKPVVTEPEF
jgi:hypothetical protein